MSNELQFLFESRHYAVDQALYERTRDSDWVDAVFEKCKTTSPKSWDSLQLVAIAQFATPIQLEIARSLLRQYVRYYSDY